VQVDTTTGEIKGFQIEESEESSFPRLSRGTLLLVAGLVGIVIITVYALKTLGFF
jgi:hypothetical protein